MSTSEVAKGSPFQNFQYRSKEGIHEEIGERPTAPTGAYRQQRPKVLDDHCKNRTTFQEMHGKDNLFVLSLVNQLKRIKSNFIPDRPHQTELYLIVGDPGVGKTSFACKLSKTLNIKTSNMRKWRNNYEQQDVVILDDFHGWLSPPELFNLADCKPLLVQVKGGFTKFTSKAIIITSNRIPEKWWKADTIRKYNM
ncbi:unnamed protein product [Thelazia callipaeda]|uniref:RNA_helicase domain-containing protein n=1 Tax=Thelazia callipaeda TaxID=103827 RepID=A0A0N5D6Z0_THECL|nr:unnamed protein product [Thelazia callipaeda]